MKKIIITVLFMVLGTNTAVANCLSGICVVEINCTTGEVTYRDAPPRESVPAPVLMQPVVPTHTINVQTSNQSWGTSGTPEQIAVAVAALAPAPVVADPCANGGCTKVEVNATTGVTTISPLSESDLKQRAKDQVERSQQQAELAKTAYQALPNITIWQPYDPFTDTPLPDTLRDETLSPEWWADWFESFYAYYESWFWWWAS